MNEAIPEPNELEDEDMRPEYDFRGGVRGKHYKARRNGYSIKINKEDGTVEYHHYKPLEGTVAIDRDVREYFPDAEAVNSALRSLIALIPKKHTLPATPQTEDELVALEA